MLLLKKVIEFVEYRVCENEMYVTLFADGFTYVKMNKETKVCYTDDVENGVWLADIYHTMEELPNYTIGEFRALIMEHVMKLDKKYGAEKKEIEILAERTVEILADVTYMDIALVRLIWGRTEYAVVRGLNRETKTWDYSIGYYDDENRAKEMFVKKVVEW